MTSNAHALHARDLSELFAGVEVPEQDLREGQRGTETGSGSGCGSPRLSGRAHSSERWTPSECIRCGALPELLNRRPQSQFEARFYLPDDVLFSGRDRCRTAGAHHHDSRQLRLAIG
jgi:hypothetical protein